MAAQTPPTCMTAPTIALQQLTELWIHTGTACNLECPFCLEGSRPGDTRLERIRLNDIRPHLDAAVELGVTRFCFTGGEPLIVKDIVRILEYALSLKPCLVLSNGTAPLLKRVHQLQQLKAQPHALSFRISLDYPDAQRHDSGRGWGNFQRAVEGLQLLHAQGFAISVARQLEAGEQQDSTRTAAVNEAYRQLFKRAKLPDTTPIVPLPDMGRPGVAPDDALQRLPLPASNESLMCSDSRMLVKHQGQLRVYACPFTDDDARFDLADTLPAATQHPVCLQHQRCHHCVYHAASYRESGAV